MVFLDERTPVIFLNEALFLPENKHEKDRALWHEIAHYLEEHWRFLGRVITDQVSTFSRYLDDKDLAWTESAANLVAAHMTIPTQEFLEKIGYYSSTAMQWRRIKKLLKKTQKEYSMLIDQFRFSPTPGNREKLYALKCKGMELQRQLDDAERELAGLDFTTSIPVLAEIFQTNEAFIRYKLKALELLGFEGIEDIELSPCRDAFKESRWRQAGNY